MDGVGVVLSELPSDARVAEQTLDVPACDGELQDIRAVAVLGQLEIALYIARLGLEFSVLLRPLKEKGASFSVLTSGTSAEILL